MDTARERYLRWRASLEVSDAELARRLGCDPSYPAKLASTRDPGLRVAAKIEELTADLDGGPIRAVDWVRDDAAPAHVENVRKPRRDLPAGKSQKKRATA